MKILIAAIVLMAFGQHAWAEHKVLSWASHGSFFTATVCIDGYKFVVAAEGESVSVTQFYEKPSDATNPPLPAKCTD